MYIFNQSILQITFGAKPYILEPLCKYCKIHDSALGYQGQGVLYNKEISAKMHDSTRSQREKRRERPFPLSLT